jgi:cytochrome c-type protein NapB
MRSRIAETILLAAVLACACAARAAPVVDTMRGTTPVADSTKPPLMANVENNDVRRQRAYSMQPPTIPHKIDGYQVDRKFNRCLACHAREHTGESQAVPLSVTHYMDREGNVLGEISPRRYFCIQCHVTQVDAKPLVGNTFKDVTEVMNAPAAPAPKKK